MKLVKNFLRLYSISSKSNWICNVPVVILILHDLWFKQKILLMIPNRDIIYKWIQDLAPRRKCFSFLDTKWDIFIIDALWELHIGTMIICKHLVVAWLQQLKDHSLNKLYKSFLMHHWLLITRWRFSLWKLNDFRLLFWNTILMRNNRKWES